LASWSRSRNRIDNCGSFRSIVAFLACWVTQLESGWAVTPTATTCLVLACRKNDTYRACSQIVSTVKKPHATIPSAWALRNCVQAGPQRRGAGPSPWRRSSVLTVVAPTRTPSLRSSPQTLTQPSAGSPWPSAAPAQPPRRPAAAGQAGAPCGRSICVARGRGASAAASGRDQEQWRPPLPGKRAACRGEQDAVEWVNWAGEPGGGVRVAVAAGPGSPDPWSPGQRLRGRAGGQARRRPTRLGTASADGTESLVTTRIRVSAPHKDEDQPLERDRDDKKSQIGLPPFIEGRP